MSLPCLAPQRDPQERQWPALALRAVYSKELFTEYDALGGQSNSRPEAVLRLGDDAVIAPRTV